MKPNDKAYKEFMRVYNKTHVSLEAQIMASLAAAFAAQFPPSEDYAGLISALRTGLAFSEKNNDAADAIETLLAKLNCKPKPSEDYAGLVKELREDVLQFNLKDTAYENIAKDAADAIEALLAERERSSEFRGLSLELLGALKKVIATHHQCINLTPETISKFEDLVSASEDIATEIRSWK